MAKPTATGVPPTSLAGNVLFFNGPTLLHTVAVENGAASLTTTTLTPGAHSIRALYVPTRDAAPSTSAAVVQRVYRAPTTITMPAIAGTAGNWASLTATVTAPDVGAQSGVVVFTSNARHTSTRVTLKAGAARFPVFALGVGVHSFTGRFEGSQNYAGATVNSTVTVLPRT